LLPPLQKNAEPAPTVCPSGDPACQTPNKKETPEGGSAAKPTAVTGAPKQPDTPLYVLGANDVVAITVFDEKNVTGTYAIGPDGRLSMPLIGNFKADALTIPQLTSLIETKLRDDGGILEPIVNVQLLRNNSKWYTLLGGVLRGGPVQLLRQTTILDALAAAGGFKDFANPKKIILRRGTKTFPFNYKDAIKGKHPEQNIVIEDGDFIIVPE
jgi:polysaccharide export outer membrane protein